MIKSDIISSSVLLLFSIYIYVSALGFPKAEYQLSGPEFYPKLMAVLLALISIAIIVRSVLRLKDKVYDVPLPKINNPKKVIASMIATVIYVLVLKTLGFVISTFIYLTALILIMQPDKNKILLSIIISAVMTGVVYFVFAVLFSASLPTGILL